VSKITISVDNTADLGMDLYKKYDLKVIYFGVVIGEDLFLDTGINPQEIYRAVEERGVLPKTNAALEIDYRELFENATRDGGSIIHFSISDKLSASHQNAKRASADYPRAYVIDSKSVSCGTGLLAIKASELVKQGKGVDEILETIQPMVNRINAGFIIKDLNYLYRGGRASNLKLLGANILKIRPALQVNDQGKVVLDKNFKGQFAPAVHEWTEYKMTQTKNADREIAFVVHSDIDESIATHVVTAFKNDGFNQVIRLVTGTTLTTHVGRNMIGVLFLEKE